MDVKRRGMVATMAGVAVTWLCLAVGDGGLGATGAEAAAAQHSSPNPNWSEADFRIWLPRALAGDPQAAFKLGRAYAEGESRWEDFGEAARWLRRAAQAGHGPAQADLAMLYGKGLGVPQDYVWSYAWFSAAADNLDGGMAREQALELRNMMAAFLTAEQRDRAERLAEQLKDIRRR